MTFLWGVQYSFSLTTFSPSGKLMQIEYALNAVQAGAISLGIKATNGVVLATEKKLPSTLIEDSTVRKISDLTDSVGAVYSGMRPDNRVLVKEARKKAEQYKRQYNEEVPVAQIVRDVAATMQEFTRASQSYIARCMLLHVTLQWHIAGNSKPWLVLDLDTPIDVLGVHSLKKAVKHVYNEGFPVAQIVRDVAVTAQEFTHVARSPRSVPVWLDPSGAYFAWKASAIGCSVLWFMYRFFPFRQ
jgi:hypothetical protein